MTKQKCSGCGISRKSNNLELIGSVYLCKACAKRVTFDDLPYLVSTSDQTRFKIFIRSKNIPHHNAVWVPYSPIARERVLEYRDKMPPVKLLGNFSKAEIKKLTAEYISVDEVFHICPDCGESMTENILGYKCEHCGFEKI